MIDQLIPVLVVGAIALGKWLFENAGRSQGGDEPTDEVPRPQPRPNARPRNLAHPEESDEEKMRRFMEALGLPPESAPPLTPVYKPASQAATERLRRRRVPAEPARPAVPAQPVKAALAPQPVRPHIAPTLDTGGPLPEIPKVASVSETAPASEVMSIPKMVFVEPEQMLERAPARDGGKPASRATAATPQRQLEGAVGALRDQLRTPEALRHAILLREILGAPKGLQSTQSSTNFSPL
jgi:hypothetical protein